MFLSLVNAEVHNFSGYMVDFRLWGVNFNIYKWGGFFEKHWGPSWNF